MIEYSGFEYLKLAIYYASYLYFPAAAILIWAIVARPARQRWIAGVFLFALSVLGYARFIEPRILLTAEHDIELKRCFAHAGSMRLAVFSDTHYGLFGNAMPIARIAKKVNAAKPDAVLIAGDFTSLLRPEKFDETFGQLREIEAPVYAVLGNHDGARRSRAYSAALSAALRRQGVNVIDNARATLKVGGLDIEFAGVSDGRVAPQDFSVANSPSADPRFLLVHNPKSVFRLPSGATVDLLIAGHTHGGQIYLPGVTCPLIRFACAVDRYGVADLGRVEAFVTSGTGMSGLPMRFNMPPRVDVLNVSYKACPPD